MELKKISMPVPQDILYELDALPIEGRSLEDKLKINLAIGLFVSRDISAAKSAQLAGRSFAEFMNILKSINISVVDYTQEMLSDDLRFIKKYESISNKV